MRSRKFGHQLNWGSLAATLGIAGLLTQAYCYLAIKGFLGAYGIEPYAIGITPLNAILRMARTAISLAMILASITMASGYLIAIRRFARSDIVDDNEPKLNPPEGASVQVETLNRRGLHAWDTRRAIDLREFRNGRTQKSDHETPVNNILSHAPKSTFSGMVLIIVSIIGLVFYDAGSAAGKTARMCGAIVPSRLGGILLDELRPLPVRVEFIDPKSRPSFSGDRSPNVYFGQLLGDNSGRSYVYLYEYRTLLQTPTVSAMITYVVPERGARIPALRPNICPRS